MFRKVDILLGVRSREIESAFLFGALRRYLTEVGRSDLIPHVTSIRVVGNRITVKTRRTIINAELGMFREGITELFSPLMKQWGKGTSIVVIFR